MNRARLEAWYRIGASIFVFVLLAGQAATLPVTASGRTIIRNKLFPILEYPMYGVAHYEGERVTGTWLLEGVYDDGSTIQLGQDILRLSTWDFIRVVQHTLRRLPGARENFEEVIRTRAPRGELIQEVRIMSYPIRVTRNGPEKIPSETVMVLPIQAPARGRS